MISGWLRIKGTLTSLLLVGMSWQHLWWSDRADTRDSRQKVIPSGTVVGAARCPGCETIAFMPAGR